MSSFSVCSALLINEYIKIQFECNFVRELKKTQKGFPFYTARPSWRNSYTEHNSNLISFWMAMGFGSSRWRCWVSDEQKRGERGELKAYTTIFRMTEYQENTHWIALANWNNKSWETDPITKTEAVRITLFHNISWISFLISLIYCHKFNSEGFSFSTFGYSATTRKRYFRND